MKMNFIKYFITSAMIYSSTALCSDVLTGANVGIKPQEKGVITVGPSILHMMGNVSGVDIQKTATGISGKGPVKLISAGPIGSINWSGFSSDLLELENVDAQSANTIMTSFFATNAKLGQTTSQGDCIQLNNTTAKSLKLTSSCPVVRLIGSGTKVEEIIFDNIQRGIVNCEGNPSVGIVKNGNIFGAYRLITKPTEIQSKTYFTPTKIALIAVGSVATVLLVKKLWQKYKQQDIDKA